VTSAIRMESRSNSIIMQMKQLGSGKWFVVIEKSNSTFCLLYYIRAAFVLYLLFLFFSSMSCICFSYLFSFSFCLLTLSSVSPPVIECSIAELRFYYIFSKVLSMIFFSGIFYKIGILWDNKLYNCMYNMYELYIFS
jgi:hypothetical protein